MPSAATLTPAVRDAIKELYRPSSLLEKLFRSRDRKKNALAVLARARERSSIPFLLPVVLSEPGQVRERARNILRELTFGFTSQDFLELEAEIRQGSPYLPESFAAQPGWFYLEPLSVDRLEDDPALLGLISFHPSGFVREAALRKLARCEGGSEIPFLLIRLNDWVKEVRDAALVALKPKLVDQYADRFAAHLDLLQRLQTWTRTDHHPFLESVFSLLKQADGGKAVLDGLGSTNLGIRRLCYRLAVTLPGADAADLLRRAFQERDLVIVLWVVKESPKRLNKTELRTMLEQAARSHFMPVRREALVSFCQAFPDEADARLQSALMDPHGSMRQVARHALAEKGITDFAEGYRRALTEKGDPARVYAALGGLGETGSESDAPHIEPFLLDPLARVRKRALRSIAKLATPQYIETFVISLADKSPGVSRIPRNALLSKVLLVPSEKVWALFETNVPGYVQRHALSLLAGLKRWESLRYLLQAASKSEGGFRSAIEQPLESWLRESNRSFLQPTKAEMERIQSEFVTARKFLSEKHSKALAFILNSFTELDRSS
jgi:HEAT repeat protein